jgi:hypothetical protein
VAGIWRKLECGAALAIGLGTALAGCSEPAVLFTEYAIEHVLESIDESVRRRDVDGVMAFVSEDAVIEITVDMSGRRQTERYSADTYRSLLSQGFRAAQDYSYERVGTDILMGPDGRSARVRSQIDESMQVQGLRLRSRTTEDATFEVRRGEILLTSLTGTTHLSQ